MISENKLSIPAGSEVIQGDLSGPPDPQGTVIFAHGSGSSRHSPRNRYVADCLRQAGLATLLLDLLTLEEEEVDNRTLEYRFDIDLLASRLVSATDWVLTHSRLSSVPVGYFGASTGAAAALVAAAERPTMVQAVVSRGGRPDLAAGALREVTAPTLLIVGALDHQVVELNCYAATLIPGSTRIEVVSGATHLFEEPGALSRVALLAREWFEQNLIHRRVA